MSVTQAAPKGVAFVSEVPLFRSHAVPVHCGILMHQVADKCTFSGGTLQFP